MRKVNFGLELPAWLCQLSAQLLLDLPALAKPCVQPEASSPHLAPAPRSSFQLHKLSAINTPVVAEKGPAAEAK